jgi:hypothetical protein
MKKRKTKCQRRYERLLGSYIEQCKGGFRVWRLGESNSPAALDEIKAFRKALKSRPLGEDLVWNHAVDFIFVKD